MNRKDHLVKILRLLISLPITFGIAVFGILYSTHGNQDSLSSTVTLLCGVYFLFDCRRIIRQIQQHWISIRETVAEDNGVVLLRSFSDDELPFEHRELFIPAEVFSEVVAQELQAIGEKPVIVRSPRYPQPLGYSGIDLPPKDWQEHLLSMIQTAKFIVVFVNSSEGLVWEIGQLVETKSLYKTIFVVPPILKTHIQFLRSTSRIDERYSMLRWKQFASRAQQAGIPIPQEGSIRIGENGSKESLVCFRPEFDDGTTWLLIDMDGRNVDHHRKALRLSFLRLKKDLESLFMALDI